MKNENEYIEESSLSNIKNFSEIIDNINYEIKIGILGNTKNKKIYINCKPKNLSSNPIEFLLIISLKSLIEKSNKMFSNCNTIEEAFENIIYIFNNKTNSFKLEQDSLISLMNLFTFFFVEK